ncbi:hypothetical protein COCCADRAFT_8853 [Bipolaris zeicola 26-R-13]|uniref:Uncharacterized protein n=1 Tax=Cochliobolus carbonum (strain 26-R-13) TaxID=930089 RepID=W6Y1D6_COCC2|nr:uncharacterized protein COCCADRAFT_8853 [Bipolaris zeicola 26-R-13]EUC28824.1 hypothetical protein COCCADRAFT_8853 [Bipolaris zeicola 26-R-13]
MAINAIKTLTGPRILAMATLLLDYGANLEAKVETGATPLRKAIDGMVSANGKIGRGSEPGRFNMLIEKGADRYVADNAGIRIEDLIDPNYWFFDETGRLELKSIQTITKEPHVI